MVACEFLIDEKVIDGTSVRIEHHAVEDLARNHRTDIVRKHMVYKPFRVWSAYEYLTHVRDIEHSDIVAHCQMLFRNGSVLDRHIKSCERTHLGSEGHVAVMKTG